MTDERDPVPAPEVEDEPPVVEPAPEPESEAASAAAPGEEGIPPSPAPDAPVDVQPDAQDTLADDLDTEPAADAAHPVASPAPVEAAPSAEPVAIEAAPPADLASDVPAPLADPAGAETGAPPAAATACRGDGTCGSETCTCEPQRRGLDRRTFLGFGLTIAAGVAGAVALSRLAPVFAESDATPSPIVPAYDPERVAWTFIVDSNRCIGCGLCVAACKEENNLPEDAHYNRTWVERYVQTADGALQVDSPEGGIHGFPPVTVIPGVAAKQITEAFFAPRLCMQCANPPCVSVCPVSATYVTPEGIVLVDEARCIGCAYCIVACPYGARYLIPATERTPLGIPGVADKCTWCYHRIARGLVPACVEVCPVGARKFGDRNDPASEVAAIMASEEAAPLWPEYGTEPRLYYLGPVTELA